MMKKRKRGKCTLGLLLGGLLMFSTPLQTLAVEETPVESPTEAVIEEELPAAETESVEVPQEDVSVMPVFTEDTVTEPVQDKTEEQVVLPEEEAGEETDEAAVSEIFSDEVPSETPAAEPPSEIEELPENTEIPEIDSTESEQEADSKYAGMQNLEAVTSAGVYVQVSFDAGTFGEDALPQLQVKDGTEEGALSSAQKALPDQVVLKAVGVDISFLVKGLEVQLLNGQTVSVQISLPGSLNPEGEQGNYSLIHEHEGKAEIVNTAAVSDSEAVFHTDSFSRFIIARTSDRAQSVEPTVNDVDENQNDADTQPSETEELPENTEIPEIDSIESEQEADSKYAGMQNLEAVTSAGVHVQVSFEAGTFGEDALPQLQVKDGAEEEALSSAQEALPDQEVLEAMSVDISFFVKGQEVQPQNGKTVSVQIDLPESLNPEGEQGTYSLIHEHEGKAEIVSTADVSDSEALFQTDRFSSFIIIWTSDRARRVELTVHYVDENEKDIYKYQNSVSITNSSGSVNLASQYGANDINNYRYYGAYILDNGTKKTITDIRYQRSLVGRYYTYTVSYLNDGAVVTQDVTNNTNGVIRRDIYMEYHTIFSGNHDASVYFLLKPTSNANSNDTTHWNSSSIAVGLGDAVVNLENAFFASDNKNVFKDRDGNGNLGQYIVNWPDRSKGATWTINSTNTSGQWDAITSDVAREYQAELQKQLGTSTMVSKNDIESITVTPYKISINNGNISAGGGQTEMIHIDCTISVVCRTAYHYAFVVDYPNNSRFTDGTVQEGDKVIHVSGTQSIPDAVAAVDQPVGSMVPETVADQKGVQYIFDGWYRAADYSNKASFDYSPTMDEITTGGGTIFFYARYRQLTRNVSVTKVWDDSDNQDGKRPNNITVKLLANGQENGKTLILAAGEGWTSKFENLPILDDSNQEISYSVQEAVVPGYTAAVSGSMDQGFTITNKHTPETVRIRGTKTWNDHSNQDGKRPSEITIRLHANGAEVDSLLINENMNEDIWSFGFQNHPKYEDGEEILYTVTEDRVEGYTTTVNNTDFNITNSYTPSKVSVSVTKNWNDNQDQDGIRPNSVSVRLLANGTDTGRAETLSAGTNWTASFTDLNEYDNGRTIVYTVEEMDVPSGYISEVKGDAKTGFIIVNTHTPETMSIQGTKTWDDNHNQDGKRPSEITIRLHADGIEVESLLLKGNVREDTWNYEFKNLPKYASGQEIHYAVTEDAVDNYSTEANGFHVTNSYTPEKTSVSVTKDWDDNHNQDGIRPNKVTVQLYQNGNETGKTVELNEANNWSDTFTNLDLFQDGKRIEYSVKEETVQGYQSVVSGDAEEGFTITNAHTPETISIHGTKNWINNSNSEENRPDSVIVRLHADGEPLPDHVQTVIGDKSSVKWEFEFTELPKYSNGEEILYTITEDHVEEYTTFIDNKIFSITNTYNPDLTSISVSKAWEDNHDQDGIRPEDVTIKLLADGVSADKELKLSESNQWTGTFENLNLRNSDGKVIAYTVEEVSVKDYVTSISGDAETGYLITNAYTPERITVAGTKVWNDQNNQNGLRPSLITIRLYADGEEVQVLQSMGKQNADIWNYEFRNLPKKADGKVIQYAVAEDPVEGYSTVIKDYQIMNTLESTNPNHPDSKVTSISVKKFWDDNQNKDGVRPSQITVVLVKNGKLTDQKLILNAGNHWQGTFDSLPVYESGEKNEYTVSEEQIDGYTARISGNAESGYQITNVRNVIQKNPDAFKSPDSGAPLTPQKSQDSRGRNAITSIPNTCDANDVMKYSIMLLAGLAVMVFAVVKLIKHKNSVLQD